MTYLINNGYDPPQISHSHAYLRNALVSLIHLVNSSLFQGPPNCPCVLACVLQHSRHR